MESSQLLEVLSSLEARPLESLEARKREELEFHNQHHAQAHDSNEKWYAVANAPGGVIPYMHRWIADNTRGKVHLDYACGTGLKTVLAAKSGAALAVGIDISNESLRLSRERAEGLKNIYFAQADCEATGLPENSFDTLLCSGMLHHLDLNRAIPEIKRILKPGGKALAVEALAYNPGIQLYRRFTRHLRTDWEWQHLVSHKHIRFIRQHLQVQNIRYWHLAGLGAVLFRNTHLFPPLLTIGNALDSIIRVVPGLRLMTWQISFEMIKA